MKILFTICFVFLVLTVFCQGEVYDGRYGWPRQKDPKGVIICSNEGLSVEESMLLESLSGLAAQAVNNGRFSDMVWIDFPNAEYEALFDESLKTLNIVQPKRMEVWELLKYLKQKNVVKGYVLYSYDRSEGGMYSARTDIDHSSNVATIYCALMNGVLIDKSIESKARSMGLKLLKDATDETIEQCFEKNKSKLQPKGALAIDPKVTNCRDIAIAQKMMLYYGTGEFSEKVLEWVTPLSPILGWNCGHEDEYTGAITRWGHYNTASNWCWNLPFLSAASSKMSIAKVEEITPQHINWKDSSSFHSFLMSDGDNMQWTMGGFIQNKDYFGNPISDKYAMSWTLCPINLSIMSAATWNQMCKLKLANSSFVEYGGGYQYPDEFAKLRPNRKELVREFAKRMNYHFKKMNLKIFGFICKDFKSPEMLEALQIYAEELEDITGMIAVQYYPYELGGETIWVKNRNGVDIPVVSAKYCMWEKTTNRSTCGTPDYIATMVNRDAINGEVNNKSAIGWTIVNAWSNFNKESVSKYAPNYGANTAANAEDMMLPIVKNVSLNEILWRIRMQEKEQQTKRIINE